MSTQTEGEGRFRLPDFIEQRLPKILAEWECRVRELPVTQGLSTGALRDHIPELLERIARVVRTVHGGPPTSLDDLPDVHALDRLDAGFDLRAAANELAVLRDVILEMWEREAAEAVTVKEIQNLSRAIDETLTRSVDRFARARERTLRALDRVSSAALGTGELKSFLPRLLTVLLETTEAVDSAAILLREGEHLCVRAAAGLEEEVVQEFSVKLGEGFAGTVGSKREPVYLRDASTDPLVVSPAFRRRGIHALYGVPLVHGDELIGVAHMGSRTAYEFSAEDQQLFRTLAHRATSLIVQAQLLEQIQVSEERFRILLAGVKDYAIVMLDAEGRVASWSAGAERIKGYAADEIIGAPYESFFPPDAREAGVPQRILEIARTQGRCEDEGERVRKDGTRFWAHVTLSPLYDPQGRLRGYAKVTGDFTERKLTQMALHERDQRLRMIVEASGTGTWELDAATKTFTGDERQMSLLGFPCGGRVTMEQVLEAIRPEDRERTVAAVEGALRGENGGRYVVELRAARHRNGGELWLESRGQAQFAADGRPLRMLGTTVDITDRKRAEQEVVRRGEFAGELMAIVSHDLRSPISAILLSASTLLKRWDLDQRQRGALERMISSAQRATRMIGDLLDFTRAQVGSGIPVERTRLDFDELVAQVVDEVRLVHPEREVHAEWHRAGEGEWDADRLAQIVTNLLTNALQHSPEGSLVRVTSRGDAHSVALEIWNEGGIPESDLPRVFEPYQRGRRAAKAGVGLGLYITRQLVEAHGGRVGVRSSDGEGTIFTVTLPRAAPSG